MSPSSAELIAPLLKLLQHPASFSVFRNTQFQIKSIKKMTIGVKISPSSFDWL